MCSKSLDAISEKSSLYSEDFDNIDENTKNHNLDFNNSHERSSIKSENFFEINEKKSTKFRKHNESKLPNNFTNTSTKKISYIHISTNSLQNSDDSSQKSEDLNIVSLHSLKTHDLNINNDHDNAISQQVIEQQIIVDIADFNSTNNYFSFMKYNIKAILIFLIYIILLRVLNDLVGRYCYSMVDCDCSDDSTIIKIWTIFIIQRNVCHFTYNVYLLMPELLKIFKSQLILQLIVSTMVLLTFGLILDGQSLYLPLLREIGYQLNTIFYVIFVIKFLGISYSNLKFAKNELIMLVVPYTLLILTALFGREFQKNLENRGIYGSLGHNLVVFVIINGYVFWSFQHIPKLKVQKGEVGLVHDKHVAAYEYFSIPMLTYLIGLMFKGDDLGWNYYFYLIFYMIFSINLQTNLITNMIRTLYLSCSTKTKWNINKRSVSNKIAAGRKIIFSMIIWINLLFYVIIQKWNDYHYNNTQITQGCFMDISSHILIQLSMSKVFIFLAIDLIFDFGCYMYNKKTKFKNVIYLIPQRGVFVQGLSFYFTSFVVETIIYVMLW